MKPLRFFFLLLALASAAPLRAAAGELHYLNAGVVDATALLAPPPVRGSAEDQLDFDNTGRSAEYEKWMRNLVDAIRSNTRI